MGEKRGLRGYARMAQLQAVQRKVVGELLRNRALTAQELRHLCLPFAVKTVLKYARWFGLKPRQGRAGGFEVVDEAALRLYADRIDERWSCSRGSDTASGPDTVPEIELESGLDSACAQLPANGWRHDAVHFLVSRFSASELAGFLPVSFAAEWNRSRRSGDGAGLGAAHVAVTLVALHDTDLLANAPRLRHRIAEELGIEPLRRFHPGSPTACAFVRLAGLPRELAGEPEPERPPAIVRVTSYQRLRDLVDYQTTGKDEMLAVIRGGGAAIYSVPTGAGKTRTAWEAVYDFVSEVPRADPMCLSRSTVPPFDRSTADARNLILWLAHRNELLDQACACLEDVWHSRHGTASAQVVRLWGRNARDALARLKDLDPPAEGCVVIVSTPATMAAVLGNPERAPVLRKAIIERSRAIVVDEAHRAAAPSYVRIVRWLRPGCQAASEPSEQSEPRTRPAVALLGLTATPFRGTTSPSDGTLETLELKEIFGHLIVPEELGDDPQRRLVTRRILARPVFEDLSTGVELDVETQVKRLLAKTAKRGVVSAGREELIDRWLAATASVSSPERHARVLRIVLERARDPEARILYFGHSVADAQLMRVALLQAGIPAGVVWAGTRPWTRRALIEEFRSGAVRVLCNCEVLTAGFDAPLVTHVVVARPTVSVVLYQQMIGRGLRGPEFGGTERCVIVNCIDRVKIGRMVLAYRRYRELWEGDGVTDDG